MNCGMSFSGATDARRSQRRRKACRAAGVPEERETVRIALDLARLRSLPAPGRRELVEALQAALAQGEPRAAAGQWPEPSQRVLVGERQGGWPRAPPGRCRRPHVEALVAARCRRPGRLEAGETARRHAAPPDSTAAMSSRSTGPPPAGCRTPSRWTRPASSSDAPVAGGKAASPGIRSALRPTGSTARIPIRTEGTGGRWAGHHGETYGAATSNHEIFDVTFSYLIDGRVKL
jgi:hypothetical protein